ncbi:MAG TPA: CCA tRNA nucleotidyltransferase, partial [Acidimicrobiia bacterium]|nr:CCA tRNA nucleotidyltransferase [Acidimicrobiia bacterium]
PNRLSWLVEPGSPSHELAERFTAAGHSLYLVGGSVRDAFLERSHTDLDFTTDARPEQIREIVDSWADAVYRVGEAFGTIGLRKDGLGAEITTFRSEIYRDDSRKPVVSFSHDLEEDLSRRDFTINAIALRLPDLKAVDPYAGLADLAAGRLDTPLDPDISFTDDPLRMLRLFRFQATLGFSIEDRVREAAHRLAPRLEIVSAERIRDELSRLLLAVRPAEALLGVVTAGLSPWFLPELDALAMEQDPVHQHKDVLAHTLAVVEKTQPELVIRLAALLHDVGKPDTRAFGPEGVSFHHHEVVGQRMARERLRALRYPREIVDDVSRLVFLHLRPHTLKMGWTDAAVRRYVRDAGHLLAFLNELVRCDVTTANPRKAAAISARIDELEERIAALRQREALDALRPPIDGHQVMDFLGIKPGPAVGEIMDLLYERRIEEGPFTEEEALAMVKEWWEGRPAS